MVSPGSTSVVGQGTSSKPVAFFQLVSATKRVHVACFNFQIDMVHLVAVLKEVSFFLATAMLCHPLRWKGGQTSACLSASRFRVWAAMFFLVSLKVLPVVDEQ